jgi:DNA (cytosine-5)-methyltransferase 1
MVYYNEWDKQNAAYLRRLISEGLIADGEVDERSIEYVRPGDLAGFTQAHFFAGIGGWSLALKLAGWPDDRPVWTGSCPCQSFSVLGEQRGFEDERHLWPEFFRLIEKCRPVVLFGEQVAAAAGEVNGDCWLDLVHDDLERAGYAVGSAVFPAGGVGAPHSRDRLYFVADSGRVRHEPLGQAGECGLAGGSWTEVEWVLCADGLQRAVKPGVCPMAHGVSGWMGAVHGAGNAIVPGQAAAFVLASVEAIGDLNRIASSGDTATVGEFRRRR